MAKNPAGNARARLKILPLVAVALLLIWSSFALGAGVPPPGDINNDGKIDVKDVVLVMQHVLGLRTLSASQQAAADVNGDGKIDVYDVAMIMQRSLDLIDSLPEPVSSVEEVEISVEYGRAREDISFPAKVMATLRDDSKKEIAVRWDEDSTPAYNRLSTGSYTFQGDLVNLPQGVTNPEKIKAKAVVTVFFPPAPPSPPAPVDPQYDLTLEANPPDGGTLDGAGSYEEGTEVTVRADANPGYDFDRWTRNGDVVSSNPLFTYTMPAESVTLVAHFTLEEPVLVITSVEAITETGITVTFAALADDLDGVTIEVIDPDDAAHPVEPLDLEAGDTEATFDFIDELAEVMPGYWSVNGLPFLVGLLIENLDVAIDEMTETVTVTAVILNADALDTATVELYAWDEDAEDWVGTAEASETGVAIEDDAIEVEFDASSNGLGLDSGKYLVVVTVGEMEAELEFELDLEDVRAAVEAVNSAVDGNDQIALLNALGAPFFQNVDDELIAEYIAALSGGEATAQEIQDVIDEVNLAVLGEEVLEQINNAANQIQLQTALQRAEDLGFIERFNPAYIVAYWSAHQAEIGEPKYDDLVSGVKGVQEDLIDAVNDDIYGDIKDEALDGVDRDDLDAARAALQWTSFDETAYADETAELDEHELLVALNEAAAADDGGAFMATLEAIEADHTDGGALDLDIVYEPLLDHYMEAVASAGGGDKNTVDRIQDIIETVNQDAVDVLLAEIDDVEDPGTPTTALLEMLQALEAITPVSSGDEDFNTDDLNEEWLEDYRTAIAALTLAGFADSDERIEAVADAIDTVNDEKAVAARALLQTNDDDDDVLQALKDLFMTDVVDANVDYYRAEIAFQQASPQSKDFTEDNSTATAYISDSDIQTLIVDLGNEVAAVMEAETVAAARAAIAKFVESGDDYYEGLLSAQRNCIAVLFMTDRDLDSPEGDYANHDAIVGTIEDIVDEFIVFIDDLNDLDTTPDHIAAMVALLNNDDVRAYILFAAFEALEVDQQFDVAEAFIDGMPADGYTLLANVRADLQAIIDAL